MKDGYWLVVMVVVFLGGVITGGTSAENMFEKDCATIKVHRWHDTIIKCEVVK